MAFLEIEKLTKAFGGLRANDEISFSLERKELVGLIGPNGAGKTTLFNCISGHYPITSGRILFDGEDITLLKAHDVARRGIARTFQVYVASGDLTVEENVMVGCFMHTGSRSAARSLRAVKNRTARLSAQTRWRRQRKISDVPLNPSACRSAYTKYSIRKRKS